jgi:hypothetical protein
MVKFLGPSKKFVKLIYGNALLGGGGDIQVVCPLGVYPITILVPALATSLG